MFFRIRISSPFHLATNYIHSESKLPKKRKKTHAQTWFLSQLLEVKLELCRLFILDVNNTVAQSVCWQFIHPNVGRWYRWIWFITDNRVEHVWLRNHVQKFTGITSFDTKKFSEPTFWLEITSQSGHPGLRCICELLLTSEWVSFEWLDETGSKFWFRNTCEKVKLDL